MTTIDEIKDRINILDIVSETVQLRRSGKNYTGFCPFHANTRTPAFVVFADSGTWRCFGQCNEGGDIFKYVMKKEGWDFSEALKFLAEKAGVQLKPPTAQEQAAAEAHEGLRTLMEEAVTFYRHHLTQTQAGKVALEYLRAKRGLKDSTIEAFGLGYAPPGWDVTLAHFQSKGYTEADLLATGLVTERDSGGVYDKFRNRIMFPIRDERGRMAGFGARILDPEDVPKFMNSPQTAIFDKGRLLYGLDRARRNIREKDQAVIVEGYLDVIALHQAGFTNVVSPMGTALTEHQLHLLQRASSHIVLALDPDAAGDKATLRGLQIARQSLDREVETVFDARGLLQHESRLQADIRVTTLPAGLDPDEVVNRDPKEWERILETAKPVVVHVMETLAAGKDLDDPKVKSDLASQVLPLIEDVPNPVERDAYRQRLARLLRVDERALQETGAVRTRLGRAPRRRPVEGAAPSKPDLLTSITTSNYSLEARCLGILLRSPELLHRVDRNLQAEELPRLSVDDFQHADHQAIFRLFQESIDQDLAEPVNYVMNYLDLPMMDLCDGLLERTSRLDPVEDAVLEELMRSLIAVRKRRVMQHADYIRFLMEEAQGQGDLKSPELQQEMLNNSRMRKRLDHALGKYTDHSITVR